MKLALNFVLLCLSLAAALWVPEQHFEYETIIQIFIALSYLIFYLFTQSKNQIEDIFKVALALLVGLGFDSIFLNINLYFYTLIDYPFFTTPPPWVAVFWLIIPINVMRLRRHPLVPYFLGFLHVFFLSSLDSWNMVFIEDPYKLNHVILFIFFSMTYKIILSISNRLVPAARHTLSRQTS